MSGAAGVCTSSFCDYVDVCETVCQSVCVVETRLQHRDETRVTKCIWVSWWLRVASSLWTRSLWTSWRWI